MTLSHAEKLKALNILSIEYIARGEDIEIIEGAMPTEAEMLEALSQPCLPDPTLEEILLTALLEIQSLKQKVAVLEGA